MNFDDITACYACINRNSFNYLNILNFWFYVLLLYVCVRYACLHVCTNMFVYDLLLAGKRIEPRPSNIQDKNSFTGP